MVPPTSPRSQLPQPTRLVAGRSIAEQWRASFLVDSTRPMRFTELDSLARRSGVAPQGSAPDTDAAHLLLALGSVRDGSAPQHSALAMDTIGARAIDGAAPDRGATVPGSVTNVLADTLLPDAATLNALSRYAQNPRLPVWRRFASSPDYQSMWQYRSAFPGARYFWSIPILRFGSMRDLAYRNALAGLLALSKGDVAAATLRARENIAAGRHILHGTTLFDSLIGLVIVGIGRSQLAVIARTTHDHALLEEATRLRAAGMRWRSEHIKSLGLAAMVADPDSREAIRYTGQLESPLLFGELNLVASTGFCLNSRELLFGTDSARVRLLHAIALASGNPRAGELELLGRRWLDDANAGTLEVPVGLPRAFAPLGWIGLRGFRDRVRICFAGVASSIM